MAPSETDNLLPKAPASMPFIRPSTGIFDKFYIGVYDGSFLSRYDYWVLNITCQHIWRCPTPTVLLPLFTSHFSANHLDIGVGTGYFPTNTLRLCPRAGQRLVLWDLSKQALATAKARVEAAAPTAAVATISADATQPLPADQEKALAASGGAKFDSVSATLVLHCIPGDPYAKALGLASNAARHLNPGGVFFGCTVVTDTKRKTTAPAGLMEWTTGGTVIKGDSARNDGWFVPGLLIWVYNRLGIFCSKKDNPDLFVKALEQKFHSVDSWIVGKMLVYRAKSPKP